MIRITVVLLIILLLPCRSLSQAVQIENFGLEEGLPSVETYFVFQD